jgi:archaellum biogenesis ATPase FlaH
MGTVSVPNIVEEITAFKKGSINEELASVLATGGNDKELDRLYTELKQVEVMATGSAATPVTHMKSIADIVDKNIGDNVIKLEPESLNAACGGGLLRGHHILIFARPDAGKTTTALSLVRGFLKQNLRVLYIGNEDPEDDILLRMAVSLSGKNKEFVINNADRVFEVLVEKRNYANFYFKEMWPGTLAEIESVCSQVMPDVLIVDQARNISTGANNRTQELEVVERAIRNLGKRLKMLTISFTQAGDSGDNKAVLQMGDVDSSNTGMQAAADVMVGLGCTRELEQQGRRVLSFPKNKRGSKEPVQVRFNSELQRLE